MPSLPDGDKRTIYEFSLIKSNCLAPCCAAQVYHFWSTCSSSSDVAAHILDEPNVGNVNNKLLGWNLNFSSVEIRQEASQEPEKQQTSSNTSNHRNSINLADRKQQKHWKHSKLESWAIPRTTHKLNTNMSNKPPKRKTNNKRKNKRNKGMSWVS